MDAAWLDTRVRTDAGRPLPEAADAVAEAAAAVQADAEKVGAMLDEIRTGWLWKVLTAKGG